MKIALPQFGDSVAPRFEAASTFAIVTIANEAVESVQSVESAGPEGYRQVRLLQIHRVAVLICSGIKSACRDMLVASGIAVIPNVNGEIKGVLAQYLAGELKTETAPVEATEICPVPHEELVRQARSLFEQNGYRVMPGPGPDSFLVDLVAETDCPVCQRPVRVAVCCGAHTYRSLQEVVEFHHASGAGYNARVYFSPAQAGVSRCCREYNIELIDPSALADTASETSSPPPIPLLRQPVSGHERAYHNKQEE